MIALGVGAKSVEHLRSNRKEYQVIPALKAPTRNFTVNVSASVPTLSFAHQLALPQRGVFFFDTYGKLHFFFAS